MFNMLSVKLVSSSGEEKKEEFFASLGAAKEYVNKYLPPKTSYKILYGRWAVKGNNAYYIGDAEPLVLEITN